MDGAFLGAAVEDHLDQIERVGDAGIVGFKAFLHELPEGRGKEFEGLCCRNTYELYCALKKISLTGLLAAAHIEGNDMISNGIRELCSKGMTFPRAHCLFRPPVTEVFATGRVGSGVAK